MFRDITFQQTASRDTVRQAAHLCKLWTLPKVSFWIPMNIMVSGTACAKNAKSSAGIMGSISSTYRCQGRMPGPRPAHVSAAAGGPLHQVMAASQHDSRMPRLVPRRPPPTARPTATTQASVTNAAGVDKTLTAGHIIYQVFLIPANHWSGTARFSCNISFPWAA